MSDLTIDGAGSVVNDLVSFADRTGLVVDNLKTGRELWISDGTSAGTRLIADLRPSLEGSWPQSLRAVGNHLIFAADDGGAGLEPWISDGTADGTHRLADVLPGLRASSPAEFTVLRNRLLFSAADGAHGRELFALPIATEEESGK